MAHVPLDVAPVLDVAHIRLGVAPVPLDVAPVPRDVTPVPLDVAPVPLDVAPIPLGVAPAPLDVAGTFRRGLELAFLLRHTLQGWGLERALRWRVAIIMLLLTLKPLRLHVAAPCFG